ncbi:super-infection exclusion protein B [Acinetobacter sp. 1125_18A]|uniref:super-infection exclusion protein B n=1 Tax=Acinetobacter sp. 1125_18A TaxID=2605959 RepID=UPI004057DE00
MDIKPFTDILSKFNSLLFAVFASTGVITFDIFSIKEKIGLSETSELVKLIGLGIGILWLLSGFCLLILLVEFICSSLKNRYLEWSSNKYFKNNFKNNLNSLSNKEIVILLQYLEEDANTIWLPIDAPEVIRLLNNRFLILESNEGRNMSNGMIICLLSINTEVKDEIFNHITEKFGESLNRDIVNNFIRRHQPSYLISIKEHKQLWKI